MTSENIVHQPNPTKTTHWPDGRNAPAMVLAAGRGERMRPLTDTCPKPLLQVRGKALIQWHLEALAYYGCSKVVVNTAWLGSLIEETIVQQVRSHVNIPILYSHEGQVFGRALETAGGIVRALPLLCSENENKFKPEVFWVVAGDVYAPGFSFEAKFVQKFIKAGTLAHIWLVPNPSHNPKGDFGLKFHGETTLAQLLTEDDSLPAYTYSTIGLFRKELFMQSWSKIAYGNPEGQAAPLAPLLRAAMAQGGVSAELYGGEWTDVGTPQRLASLNNGWHAA